MSKKNLFIPGQFCRFTQSGHAFTSVACVRSQRKLTYVLRVTRSCFLEWLGERWQWGRGMGRWRRGLGGGGGGGERWRGGDSSEVLWRIFAKLGGCIYVDLPFALEGFFFEKVNGSTGQRVTFTFNYIIYAPASRHTAAKGPFCLLLQSLIRRLLLHCISMVYVRGPRNCPWGVLFLKGQRVNGSNGSTGHISTVYVGGPRNCPWGVLFRKGQQVDGSTGQTGQTGRLVNGSLSLSLYYIW